MTETVSSLMEDPPCGCGIRGGKDLKEADQTPPRVTSTEKGKDPDPLSRVSTSANGCRDGAGDGSSCAGPIAQQAVVDFVEHVEQKKGGLPPKKSPLVAKESYEANKEKAAEILGCDDEACVVSHGAVVDFLVEKDGNEMALKLKKEVLSHFAVAGPHDSTDLLSNFDLDGVLQGWALEFPTFFNCPFCMFDFETEGYLFGRIHMPAVYQGKAPQLVFSKSNPEAPKTVRRPCTTFACILNTDHSSGKGKHWVCMFVDMRGDSETPWTVEYFNSSGRPPPKQIIRWMEKTADALRDLRRSLTPDGKNVVHSMPVTKLSHQQTKTECGVYACFYIRARLEGNTPWQHFSDWRIDDSSMTAFRKHLFSGVSF